MTHSTLSQAATLATAALDEKKTTMPPEDYEYQLPTAAALHQQYPLGQNLETAIEQHRQEIQNIVSGRDKRLLVVIGPCSIHDTRAALEYGQRLAQLSDKLKGQLKIVMRCYLEKPRTTVGWKGLVYDPLLDDSHDVTLGLTRSRRLMLQLTELGLPLATESLSTIITDYLQDMVSWTAIGARTSESQLHREMASGLTCAVGFKNGTDGNADAAIQSIQSCAAAHCYPTFSSQGQPTLKKTNGNSYGHLVLRGGNDRPNYDEASVKRYEHILKAQDIHAGIMVDCSHGNSFKDHRNQHKVLRDIIRQLKTKHSPIMGVMMESFLNEGKQSIHQTPLKYGVSVTDACIGWNETQELLTDLANAIK